MNYFKTKARKIVWAAGLLLMSQLGFAQVQPDTANSLPAVLLPSFKVSTAAPNGEHSFSVSTVNLETIKENIGNGSVNNMFDRLPSMVTTSDAGTGLGYSYLRIRGIDHTRINVTVNGIALNDAESQGTWFVDIPDFGTKVQSLEVQRGAGTSNNGASAFGATMNFTTLLPSATPFAEVSSAAGSFYTFRNSVSVGTGLIKKRFSAEASYSNILTRGYIDNSGAKLHSIFFTANYFLLNEKKNKDYGRLQFNLIYGSELTDVSWNGVPHELLETNRTYNSCGEYYDADGNRQYYDNTIDNYKQTHYQLHYFLDKNVNERHEISLKTSLHLTRGFGYYEEYKDDYTFETYGLQPFLSDTAGPITTSDFITQMYMDNYFYGGTVNFSHTIDKKFTWMLGGAVNRYDGKHYSTIIWSQYTDIPHDWHWHDATGDKRQYNIYGKFIANLNGKNTTTRPSTILYADLQYRCIDYRIGGINDLLNDVTQSYVWHFINPKAGVEYSWNAHNLNHQLYFTFSVANREPTRSDLTNANANQKPKPETLYDFELGYLLKHDKAQFSADAYFMYYHDQLVLTGEINNVGTAIMTNVGKSFRTGIELSAGYQPLRWLRWQINGTFSLNKILGYTEYVDDWDTGEQRVNALGTTDISFSPSIIANNEFVFTPVRNFDISFVTKFVSRQYIDNSSRKEYSIDPYCVNNLQLSYKIETKVIHEIGLFFQVNNIFNAKYESNAWLYRYYYMGEECSMDGYFPQAGINFLGGIRLKW